MRSRIKMSSVFVVVTLLAVVMASAVGSAEERMGAWVDDIILTEVPGVTGVTMLQAGELDILAQGLSDPELFDTVRNSSALTYSTSSGGSNDLTFNPAGPILNNGKLNPFADKKIREAMNWLVDRNYIANEIYGGMAIPRYVPIPGGQPDYARYADIIRGLELEYAYNPDRAKTVISEEMEKLGANLVNGKWTYNGEPVILVGLIRTEDERLRIGDYVANQLESIGFTVERQYKTAAEAAPIWQRSDPKEGKWNWYTGGWVSSVLNRDSSVNPYQMYTQRLMPVQPWLSYTPDPVLDDLATKLVYCNFTSMDERRKMWEQILPLCMQESLMFYLVDTIDFIPRRSDVEVASDLAAGVAGAMVWPYTIRFKDTVGGMMRIGLPSLLSQPWNPISGSNWVYDQMVTDATTDRGILYDPYTGLAWPQRVQKAELYAKEGLPITKTLDWVDVKFVETNRVPADAWADWDATQQRFITVGEKYPEGITCPIRSVVYYPQELYKTKWHDGSPFTIGDVLLSMILTFDRAKPESPFYDESYVPEYEAFAENFVAVKIISQDPLIIETYKKDYMLDAELSISDWYPNWSDGPAPWHTVAVGMHGEQAKEIAFSAGKADQLGVEQLNMVAGPSLDVYARHLAAATAESYVPYASFLSEYISKGEAAARYANLKKWYDGKGHVWVGSGPVYVEKAYPVEGTVHIKRYADFIDPASKWAGFGEPMIAAAEVDGPGRVKIGSTATFDVNVTFEGAAYPIDKIDFVKYLVLNGAGEVVLVGEADAVEDGLWQVNLSADDTAKLAVGANRLEVVVASAVACVPTSRSMTFVSSK